MTSTFATQIQLAYAIHEDSSCPSCPEYDGLPGVRDSMYGITDGDSRSGTPSTSEETLADHNFLFL
jgi:hypothetical protein